MAVNFNDDEWVWVVVILGAGGRDQILGQHDQDADLSFIPVFRSKEDALVSYKRFALDKEKKYEVQAMFYGELCKEARENGFSLFILDEDGKVLDKKAP